MALHSSSEPVYENREDLERDSKKGELSCFHLLLATLGILSILLLASIGVISWIGWEIDRQEKATVEHLEELINLGNKTKYREMENERFENETELLKGERDGLTTAIEYIQTFDNFSVNTYCPAKECVLCRSGWRYYEGSCYLFNSFWRTWEESRDYCTGESADLIIINNLEEQKFIHSYYSNNNNNNDYYYYYYNYYWLGLRKVNKNWVWVDGHIDTLGFWAENINIGPDYSYVWMIRTTTVDIKRSWNSPPNTYGGYTICEHKALKVYF